MKPMKRILMPLVLLAALLMAPGQVKAQGKTAKSIWCSGNKTLYFVYDDTDYEAGQTFTDDAETTSTITTVNKLYTTLHDAFPDTKVTKTSVKTVNFQPSFKDFKPTNLGTLFDGFSNLETVENGSNLNTSEVLSMNGMFSRCQKLKSVDVSEWDTQKVTTFAQMFYECRALTSLDVSKWVTSSATTLSGMFYMCLELTTLGTDNVKNWEVSNVTTLESTFHYCRKLAKLDVSKWKTGKVTTLQNTFWQCRTLTSLNVLDWETSNVTNMSSTFNDCRAIKNLSISKWKTGNVTTMNGMFNSCNALTSLAANSWDVSNVTNMSSMFSLCTTMSNFGFLQSWDVSSVKEFTMMFSSCTNLTTLNLSGWDTSSAIKMNSMFSGCNNLATLSLSWGTKTSNVTDMSHMFSQCSSLRNAPTGIGDWDVSSVTDMSAMFYNCLVLNVVNATDPLDLSKWDVSSVTNMSSMFATCKGCKSFDFVKNWNTSNVTNMYCMFAENEVATHFTFGENFSMEKVTNAANMFYRNDAYRKVVRYIDFYNSNPKNIDVITSVKRNTDQDMFNCLANTTVIYLPKESEKVTDVVNVVYSNDGDGSDLRCPHYYSEDMVDIEFPHDFKTNKAEYSRGIKAETNYGTVILPYKFKSNDEVQAYTLTKEYTDIMYFVEADEVPAHTPFFFAKKIKNAEEVNFVMEDTSGNFGITVEATRSTNAAETTWDNTPGAPYTDNAQATQLEGWSTKGYYVKQKEPNYNGAFYINGDKFYKASGELTLYPHRVTFHGTWTQGTPVGTSNVYNIRTLSDRDVALGIKEAETRKTLREASDVYDILGRRHDTPQKGLNIVRGQDGVYRKVFVK